MKRLFCLILALAMTASALACSGTDPDPLETISRPTVETSATVNADDETQSASRGTVDPIDLDSVVAPTREEHLVYDDADGNHYDLELSVPQITLDKPSVDVKRINSRLSDALNAQLDDAVKAKEDGSAAVISSVTYDSWQDNTGLMTLLVETTHADGTVEHLAFTVDTLNGKELTLVSMAKVLGLSGDEMLAAMTATITNFCNANLPEGSEKLLEQNLTRKNINDAQVYVDREGTTQMIFHLITADGSEEHLIPLEY